MEPQEEAQGVGGAHHQKAEETAALGCEGEAGRGTYSR